MPIENYSTDVWTYLDDMPYLPSRTDRDELVQAAQTDPTKQKRVQIWDYFFRIRPGDIGKPQIAEMNRLHQESREAQEKHVTALASIHAAMDVDTQRLTTQVRRGRVGLAVALGVGLVIVLIGYFIYWDELMMAGGAIAVLAGLLVIVLGLWGRQRLTKKNRRYEAEIARLDTELHERLAPNSRQIRQLTRQIEELQHDAPPPSSDLDVLGYLQDDLKQLAIHAVAKTGLKSKLVVLKDAPNPLCLLGPAELQKLDRIPKSILDLANRDVNKHLRARVFANLPDGRWIDLHGMYFIEFFLIAEDFLANYECVFDFITGERIVERASEQRFEDIVSLSTGCEYHGLQLDAREIPIDDALKFGLVLSSGEKFQVTFPSRGYFVGLNKAGLAAFQFDLEHWATNPAPSVDKALAELREKWRSHMKAQPG